MRTTRSIRWVDLVDVQLRAQEGAAVPDDVMRLAVEVLRCWDYLPPTSVPRTVRWIDVVEIQARAVAGEACPEDVLRLGDEVLRCWDRLYGREEVRRRRERPEEIAWRFAPGEAVPIAPLTQLTRAFRRTTFRLRRGVVKVCRRLLAEV
jgi:hypothetical protein